MIRLLRGQVVIRENLTADTSHYTHIVIPNVSNAERHDADAIQRARTWHRGIVLAMGAPMLTPRGVEVPHGFAVGDDVLFHWAHHEKAWTREWVDGLPACWVPQAFVDAVVATSSDRCVSCGEPIGYAGCDVCDDPEYA